MKPLHECRLYTFVDAACLRGRDPQIIAQQLCDGGSDIIQLRAKDRTPDEIRRMAQSIMPITARAGVGLVINDHLPIAREVGAQLCHLGQEDFFDAGHAKVSDLGERNFVAATTKFRTERLPVEIGLSSHAPEEAERAIAAGAAYVAIGPVFATGTKPAAKPVTVDYVRWASRNVPIPWFAIGGINLTTLDSVLEAGARSVCVVSAILNRDDVAQACREFRARLDQVKGR